MERIANGYNQHPYREWERLARDPYHSLEWHVYLHHIVHHLPSAGLVLDAGGGPGRYAIELSRRGYEVVLLDLSEGLLRVAHERLAHEPPHVQQRLREMTVGNVMDLSRFADATFDAVLCLDPLTYFSEPKHRSQVMTELVRVTKASALVALSVRGYLAVLRTLLRLQPHAFQNGTLERLQASGNTEVGGVVCHFFRANELQSLAEQYGLQTLLMAGGEGLSEGLPNATNRLAQQTSAWETWKRCILDMSTDRTVVDMSGHILYLGRKG